MRPKAAKPRSKAYTVTLLSVPEPSSEMLESVVEALARPALLEVLTFGVALRLITEADLPATLLISPPCLLVSPLLVHFPSKSRPSGTP